MAQIGGYQPKTGTLARRLVGVGTVQFKKQTYTRIMSKTLLIAYLEIVYLVLSTVETLWNLIARLV